MLILPALSPLPQNIRQLCAFLSAVGGPGLLGRKGEEEQLPRLWDSRTGTMPQFQWVGRHLASLGVRRKG